MSFTAIKRICNGLLECFGFIAWAALCVVIAAFINCIGIDVSEISCKETAKPIIQATLKDSIVFILISLLIEVEYKLIKTIESK